MPAWGTNPSFALPGTTCWRWGGDGDVGSAPGTWEIPAPGPQGVPDRRHAQYNVQVVGTLVHEVLPHRLLGRAHALLQGFWSDLTEDRLLLLFWEKRGYDPWKKKTNAGFPSLGVIISLGTEMTEAQCPRKTPGDTKTKEQGLGPGTEPLFEPQSRR